MQTETPIEQGRSISHGETPAPSSSQRQLENAHKEIANTSSPIATMELVPSVTSTVESERIENCCLSEYRDWLLSPVIDLGCGNGNTVKKIRDLGIECTGIDISSSNQEMRVGEFTEPIPDISNFQCAICIDYIEHLFDDQILGLFDNMRQVQRQAFSIRSGCTIGENVEPPVYSRNFIEWGELIREHFTIAAAIKISEQRMLYLTQRK